MLAQYKVPLLPKHLGLSHNSNDVLKLELDITHSF